MTYSVVKLLHIACVIISIALFILREALQLQEKPWRHRMSLRIAPHVVDTVLLGSALWLAFQIHQYPFVNSWLTAKVVVLFVYILLARQALGEHTQHRLAYFFSALLSVAYIVGVAISHSPTWGVL
ncbi:Regulator SirB [Georgfuchsia toluolica]|uniref:Regulator SirB n=1 Tax=Georgfuchsia toluolica TaxID=424218 RepID=A0A916J546_9PROT|nr:SirB2 family protein [Georgfuchsia toluolica]CAG4883365.1 Regulator SirB [Georgfuchsia toluolica]